MSIALALALALPAAAQDESVSLSYAHLCDVSGCYLATGVVDSDHDGVCDADEAVAGTDPFDPGSVPGLALVVELLVEARLPSFQATLGELFVFPDDIRQTLAEGTDSPLAAFPLGGQRETLERLGISTALLEDNGIDVSRDGVGVTFDGGVDEGVPPKRVGGIDVRLVSNDPADDPVPLDPNCGKHGPVVATEHYPNGTLEVFADGAARVSMNDGGGFVLDKDGKKVGWWYTNPEADQTVDARFAALDRPDDSHVTAILAGNVLTADAPIDPTDGAPEVPRRDLYALYDGEAQDGLGPLAVALDAGVPQDWNEAQPEVDPNLPNPLLPGVPDGSACLVGCPQP